MPFSPFLPTHFVFSFFFLLLFPTLPFYQPLFPLPPSSLYCSWSGAYFSYSTQWLLRSAVPCCSYQFERMFDTCRIPGILTGSIYILTQLAPNFFRSLNAPQKSKKEKKLFKIDKNSCFICNSLCLGIMIYDDHSQSFQVTDHSVKKPKFHSCFYYCNCTQACRLKFDYIFCSSQSQPGLG